MLPAIRILFIGLIGIISYSIPAVSQYSGFTFRHFTMKEGLSDNYIRNLYQDNRGYLWINTNEGLNRFDGYQFRRFFQNQKDSNAIASNISDRCVQLNKNELLIHTYPVMSVFNLTTQQFSPQHVHLPPNIIHVSEEYGGRCWLGYTGYLLLTDSAMKVIKKISVELKDDFAPVNIHLLKNGKRVLVTMSGIYYLDENTGKLIPLPVLASLNENERYFSFSYYHPASNTLYAGGWSSALYRIDLTNNVVNNLRKKNKNTLFSDPVNAVLKDSKNRLWIGTINGLLLFDETTGNKTWISKSNESNGISDNHIRCLFEDRDNNIWIGTVNGLNKLSKAARHMTFYSNELVKNGQKAELYDITRLSNADIIIATYGNGLFRLNEKTKSITSLPQPYMTHTWVVKEIDKELYAGGHRQLIKAGLKDYHFTPENFLSPYYKNTDLVLMVYKDRHGDNWYSMNGNRGLIRKKAGTEQFIHYNNEQNPKPFLNSYFNTVAEDESGNSWWGVNKRSELVKWNHEKEHFETIELSALFNRPLIIRRGINCLYYENGHLWIGTDGAGLYDLDIKNNTIRDFTINEGICAENITQIIGDKKRRLWIGTRKGLSCLLPDRKTFVNFTEADGLPETAFNDGVCLYDSARNLMYMGTQYFLLQFNTDELLNLHAATTNIFIDEIFVNGNRNITLLQRPLHLKSDQNNIQLNFSAIDFNNPASLQVEYKLEGLYHHWEKAGQQRSLNFLNLNEGKYSFHLRVKKPGSKEWKYLSAPVQFTITPPFWKTWWFKSLLVALFGFLLIIGFGLYYQRKIELHKLLFEKQKAIAEERSRIAADMHDDLGAGVTRIKFIAEDMEDQLPDGTGKEEIKNLKNSANELVEKMSEIIWTMNEKNNSLEDLIYYIRNYSMQYLQENNIGCTFILTSDLPVVTVRGEVRRNLLLTVKECLHNIVKHARAKKVTVKIEYNRQLLITISDDGIGIVKDPAFTGGNGLINMRKRMKELNGSIELIKINGTNVHITVPV